MQTIVTKAQDNCLNAERLCYCIKNKHKRRLLRIAIQNVYKAIRTNDIAQLVERNMALERLCKENRR